MNDAEDDNRYLPNPGPLKPRQYVSSSSNRPKDPFRYLRPPPQFGRHYADDDDEEQNHMDQTDDVDDEGSGYRRTRDYGEEDDDSSESRAKRRRIDKLSLGFELAPRVPSAAPSKPPARTSLLDWSEDSTFVLLDTWGERYLQNGRKSLRSDEWSEVAKKVSQASKVSRSDAQCRNRLDTLKKKYKKEKATMAEHGNSGSNWVYFKRMDSLLSLPCPPPPAGQWQLLQQPPLPQGLPCGVDAGEYVFGSSSIHQNHCNGNDEMRGSTQDSGTEHDGYEDDDDPAELPPQRENVSGSSDSSFKMLTESIQKFGDIYKKIENHKRQQMAELERMRREFQRDLEEKQRQILERTQVEIAKLSREQGEEDDEGDSEDRKEKIDNGDDDSSAENFRFVFASFYLTAFV